MTLTKLGELIEQSFEINSQGKYKASDVRGMTITKEVIPTKAKIKNTDLSRFLIVKPNEFIYNPRTHGKRIGLGFNQTSQPFIISWNNIAFRIKNEQMVNPIYLFMHFNRLEWDRQAVFDSWGSSTEVFSWNSLCDMEIDLPPLHIQEKYVAVYKSMLENQKAYETGLEDLKLVCVATIEKLRKKNPCEVIGNYIEQTDKRNEGKFDENYVVGISTSKEFIETKANLEGVNLNSYKVVPPKAFAYVADTSRRGEKVSLAYNNSNQEYLVSSISTVFMVSSNTKLLSEFLFIFFNRNEFDRFARYNSWGSARETYSWEDLCEFEIPIPDITIQQSIVDIYNAYITRKEINEKLKQQIKDICPILIAGAIKEANANG